MLYTKPYKLKCRFKHDIYVQAREEERARQRAEERERLEQQKQQLHAKFRRRVPPKIHSHNLGRKDTVQRATDLDCSENLLVSPVRSRPRNKELVSTEVDDTVSSQAKVKGSWILFLSYILISFCSIELSWFSNFKIC